MYKNRDDVLYLKSKKVNSFCKKNALFTINTVINALLGN